MLSVVIPCKNEKKYIRQCLNALIEQKKYYPLEIIVVDNGSTDGTIDILNSFSDQTMLLSLPEGSIAEVRNFGARYANPTHEWLAFIDGDVVVDSNWFKTFMQLLDALDGKMADGVVTGSTCLPPPSSSWIERVWSAQLQGRDNRSNTYINSGHLIISRKLFDKIGGFNTSFETGEDEKLCKDAIDSGAVLKKYPALKAYHYGYPQTLMGFFRRERWHGVGLKKHVRFFWRYRDLQIAFYTLTLALIAAFTTIIDFYPVIMVSILIICFLLPLYGLAYSRVGKCIKDTLQLTLLFSIYAIAKASALVGIAGNSIKEIFCARK